MAYVDLRPDKVSGVQVLVEGQWLDGELEAYRRDAAGTWYGWVRWRRIAGETHLDWFPEDRLTSPT